MIESRRRRRRRRRTWPDFSPCNSNSNSNSNSSSSSTNRALHINDQSSSSPLSNSYSSFKTNASSSSYYYYYYYYYSDHDFLTGGIRKQQHDSSSATGSCPDWSWRKSMKSFLEICPSSSQSTDHHPPPSSSSSPNWSINSSTAMNNSPDIISFSPTNSDIFYSQISTQFSTPRNKSSSSCPQSSTDDHEIDQEEMMNTTIINDEHFYQHTTLQSKGDEADHVDQEYSPNKRWSLSSAGGGFRSSIERCQPLLGMPLMVVDSDEEQQEKIHDKDDDYDNQRSPMYGHHSRLISRPKPYQDFLDEIRRKELEAKYNTWKEAKQLELMNRLRIKEAAIDAWELKQRKKAKTEMKKIEGQLERKRLKATEETQMKITNIKRKTEKMEARERQLVARKISMTSRITDKIKASLKCLCC